MEYKLHFSPSFSEDLYQIGDYIKTQFHDPAAADRIICGSMAHAILL